MSILEPDIGEIERREIHDHIARLLRDLGNPEPPLRLEKVRELQKLDLSYYSKSDLNLLDEMAHKARLAGHQISSSAKSMRDVVTQFGIKGLLMLKEGDKKIFIDDEVVPLKRRFVISHEIIHDLLPWHRSLLIGDNEETLNPTFHQEMEAEANYGGRRLIFMGDQFPSEARDCAFDWRSIQQFHKRYGNTLTTTLWHMVCERDPDHPAFGLISKHPYHSDICVRAGNDNVAYFPRSRGLIERFPKLTHDLAYAAVVDHASRSKRGPVGQGESVFYDANGDPHVFEIYSFSNTHDLLTYGLWKRPHRKLFRAA